MEKKRLSRRKFLAGAVTVAASTVIASCAPAATTVPSRPVAEPTATTAGGAAQPVAEATATSAAQPTVEIAKEAPMLEELVKTGELPPLVDRLPANPMVIDLPWSTPGKFGGTLRTYLTDTSARTFTQYMYGASPLHWMDGASTTGPGLVDTWEVNEDASEWTFHFREGLKWSDGTPFTVDDILFWWEDMVNNPDHSEQIPNWALTGGGPMTVTKVDDMTVKFAFAGPAPLLDFELANDANFGATLCPSPKAYMSQFHPKYNDEYADFETFNQKQNWYENPERPVLTAWKPIALEKGQRLQLERNPYYYMVDKEGRQLPYIDKVDVTIATDIEAVKLQITTGQVDFMAYPNLPLNSLTTLKQSEASGNYSVYLWNNGAGAAPAFTLNWNHLDPDMREFIRNRDARLALSHALDRERVRALLLFGLGGPASTGTVSPNTGNFNRSEEGKKLFQEWRDLAVTYDPDKANALLDKAGAIDVDGDGWRETPAGTPLKIVIYNNAPNWNEAIDILAESWKAVGINAVATPVEGGTGATNFRNGEFDAYTWTGGAPDGPDILMAPQWFVSYSNMGRWAPLYGQWMAMQGTPNEGKDGDKPVAERSPRWEEPPADDPMYRLWELHNKAIKEPDQAKRDAIVFEMTRIHIDEGPFLFGMISNLPNIIIVGNTLKNVPNQDEIPGGGWFGPWVVCQPGAITYPEQYYFDS